MRLIYTCLFGLLIISINAQNHDFQWAESIAGAFAKGVTVDNSGNVYSTGRFMGTVDFDPGTGSNVLVSNGAWDTFIQKSDPSGNFQWAISFGGNYSDVGTEITIDPNGDLIIVGTFQDTVDFNPGTGVHSLISDGGTDLFVLKLGSNGNFLWAYAVGGTGNEKVEDCVVDATGNVFLTGQFSNSVDFDNSVLVHSLSSNGIGDVFILKLDSNGSFDWVKSFGGPTQDYGYGIDLDNNGNVYTVGSYSGTVDFDPGIGVSTISSNNANLDIFVHKLNASGNFEWVQSMGSDDPESAFDVAVDNNGNILITGYFQDVVDFDPGSGTTNLTSQGGDDIFIQKLDANGSLMWVKAIGASYDQLGLSIVTDVNNNVYTAGTFRENIDFDPGSGVFNVSSVNHNMDVYILKLDLNGDFDWVKTISGSAVIGGSSLALQDTTSLFVNGYFAGTADFDTQGNGHSITIPAQGLYLAKYGSCSPTLITDVQESCSPYTWIDGNTYTANNNTATHTVSNPSGCDTLYTLDFTMLSGYSSIDTLQSCGPYTWIDGNTYSDDNNDATYTLQSVSGCDSVVTLNLTVHDEVNAYVTETDPTITANLAGANYQWLDCDNNYAPIAGATNQSFTATSNGNYAVIVSNNGCSDTSSCVTIELVGIDNHNFLVGVELYPNPTNNDFTIELGNLKDVDIAIYNVSGQLLYHQEAINIPQHQVKLNHPAGVYFVEVNASGKIQRFKLIKG